MMNIYQPFFGSAEKNPTTPDSGLNAKVLAKALRKEYMTEIWLMSGMYNVF